MFIQVFNNSRFMVLLMTWEEMCFFFISYIMWSVEEPLAQQCCLYWSNHISTDAQSTFFSLMWSACIATVLLGQLGIFAKQMSRWQSSSPHWRKSPQIQSWKLTVSYPSHTIRLLFLHFLKQSGYSGCISQLAACPVSIVNLLSH